MTDREMPDPSATWVLDNSRPDLIQNWFQYRADDCRRLAEQARAVVYAGVPKDTQPAEIVERLAALRRKGHYIFLLACEAWDKQKSSWPEAEAARLSDCAKRAIGQMTDSTAELANLHQFVVKLEKEADHLTAMMCDQADKAEK